MEGGYENPDRVPMIGVVLGSIFWTVAMVLVGIVLGSKGGSNRSLLTPSMAMLEQCVTQGERAAVALDSTLIWLTRSREYVEPLIFVTVEPDG